MPYDDRSLDYLNQKTPDTEIQQKKRNDKLKPLRPSSSLAPSLKGFRKISIRRISNSCSRNHIACVYKIKGTEKPTPPRTVKRPRKSTQTIRPATKPAWTQTVVGAPPWFTKQVRDRTCDKGAAIYLHVEVKGQPTSVKWFHNNVEIVNLDRQLHELHSDAYTLTISQVSKDNDEGTYFVEASNEFGATRSNEGRLYVNEPSPSRTPTPPAPDPIDPTRLVIDAPPWFTKELNESQECQEKAQTVLDVEVKGQPTSVKWFRNNVEIVNLDRQLHEPNSDVYTLTISQASKDNDAGTYFVKASNEFGETKSHEGKLNVNDSSQEICGEVELHATESRYFGPYSLRQRNGQSVKNVDHVRVKACPNSRAIWTPARIAAYVTTGCINVQLMNCSLLNIPQSQCERWLEESYRGDYGKHFRVGRSAGFSNETATTIESPPNDALVPTLAWSSVIVAFALGALLSTIFTSRYFLDIKTRIRKHLCIAVLINFFGLLITSLSHNAQSFIMLIIGRAIIGFSVVYGKRLSERLLDSMHLKTHKYQARRTQALVTNGTDCIAFALTLPSAFGQGNTWIVVIYISTVFSFILLLLLLFPIAIAVQWKSLFSRCKKILCSFARKRGVKVAPDTSDSESLVNETELRNWEKKLKLATQRLLDYLFIKESPLSLLASNDEAAQECLKSVFQEEKEEAEAELKSSIKGYEDCDKCRIRESTSRQSCCDFCKEFWKSFSWKAFFTKCGNAVILSALNSKQIFLSYSTEILKVLFGDKECSKVPALATFIMGTFKALFPGIIPLFFNQNKNLTDDAKLKQTWIKVTVSLIFAIIGYIIFMGCATKLSIAAVPSEDICSMFAFMAATMIVSALSFGSLSLEGTPLTSEIECPDCPECNFKSEYSITTTTEWMVVGTFQFTFLILMREAKRANLLPLCFLPYPVFCFFALLAIWCPKCVTKCKSTGAGVNENAQESASRQQGNAQI